MVRPVFSFAFALFSMHLLLGCPKKQAAETVTDAAAKPTEPKVAESCDVAGLLGFCMDYTRTDVMMHKTLCEGYKGKFAELPCSKERRVGSCAMDDGDLKRYYEKVGPKDVGFTTEKAKENCEGPQVHGTFTAK